MAIGLLRGDATEQFLEALSRVKKEKDSLLNIEVSTRYPPPYL